MCVCGGGEADTGMYVLPIGRLCVGTGMLMVYCVCENWYVNGMLCVWKLVC